MESVPRTCGMLSGPDEQASGLPLLEVARLHCGGNDVFRRRRGDDSSLGAGFRIQGDRGHADPEQCQHRDGTCDKNSLHGSGTSQEKNNLSAQRLSRTGRGDNRNARYGMEGNSPRTLWFSRDPPSDTLRRPPSTMVAPVLSPRDRAPGRHACDQKQPFQTS